MSRYAIVASRFHEGLVDTLVEEAQKRLEALGVARSQQVVVRVPGAWELPVAASWMLKEEDVAAVLTLGCIVKGETNHDEIIGHATASALQQLASSSGVPVVMGIVTAPSVGHARARCKVGPENRGLRAAEAAVAMVQARNELGQR